MARGTKAAALAAGPVEGPWELPDGWRWERLCQRADLVRGVSYSKQQAGKDRTSTRQTLLRGGNVQAGRIVFSDLVYVDMACIADEQLVRENDIVLTMSSGSAALVGKSALVRHLPEPMTFGAFCACIRAHDPQDAAWIYWFLQTGHYRSVISGSAKGTNINNLKRQDLEGLAVPVPPRDKQRHIVARIDDLFSELDDGGAALARARDDLETYRKSLLKSAVTGELTADWRAANPPQETGEQLLQRILADRKVCWEANPKTRGKRYKEPLNHGHYPLPQLPTGWTWASVDQLIAGLRNGVSKKPNPAPPGVPIFRISAVREMKVKQEDVRWLPEGFDVDGSMVAPGDLLFTRYNGSPELVGVCGRHRGDVPVAHPDKLMRAEPAFDDDSLFDYLEMAANCGTTRSFIAAYTKTSAGQHGVSGETVKTAPVPLPPATEMAEIVRLVRGSLNEHRDTVTLCSGMARTTARLCQSILSAAFQGKLLQ